MNKSNKEKLIAVAKENINALNDMIFREILKVYLKEKKEALSRRRASLDVVYNRNVCVRCDDVYGAFYFDNKGVGKSDIVRTAKKYNEVNDNQIVFLVKDENVSTSDNESLMCDNHVVVPGVFLSKEYDNLGFKCSLDGMTGTIKLAVSLRKLNSVVENIVEGFCKRSIISEKTITMMREAIINEYHDMSEKNARLISQYLVDKINHSYQATSSNGEKSLSLKITEFLDFKNEQEMDEDDMSEYMPCLDGETIYVKIVLGGRRLYLPILRSHLEIIIENLNCELIEFENKMMVGVETSNWQQKK